MGTIVKHPQLPFQLELLYHAPQTDEIAVYSLFSHSVKVNVKLDDESILPYSQVIYLKRDDEVGRKDPHPEVLMALTDEGELVDLKGRCDVNSKWWDRITHRDNTSHYLASGKAAVIGPIPSDNPLSYLTVGIAVVTPTVKDAFAPFFVWIKRAENGRATSSERDYWRVEMDVVGIPFNVLPDLLWDYAYCLGINSEEKLISYLMTVVTLTYRSTRLFNRKWYYSVEDQPF